MNDNLRIRKAVPEDATVLTKLTAQLGYPCTQQEIVERLEPISEYLVWDSVRCCSE